MVLRWGVDAPWAVTLACEATWSSSSGAEGNEEHDVLPGADLQQRRVRLSDTLWLGS